MDWNAFPFGCFTKALVACDKSSPLRLRQNKAKQIGARRSSAVQVLQLPQPDQCPAGNGYGFYADWKITPSISLHGEWAQWNDSIRGGSDNGYNAVVTWDLGTLLGLGHGLVVTTGYQYYGVNFYPPVGAAELDIFGWDYMYPGNAQGLTVTASFNPMEMLNLYVDFVTGNNVSNSQSIQEWEAGIKIALAPSTAFVFYWRDLTIAGVDQKNRYRAQLTYGS